MPKLVKAKAKAVAQAESGFELLEPGLYRAQLLGVEVKEGKKGPYWSWEYKVVENGVSGTRLWNNTSLSEDSEWKLKETFDAFGVEPDTHTDELEGEFVQLQVGIRTIQSGARQGQDANNIEQVLVDPEAASVADEEEDEEEEAAPPARAKATRTPPAAAATGKTKKKAPVEEDDEDEPPFNDDDDEYPNG